MGTKNIIGELQVNGSPVVTEDTVKEKVGLTDYVKNTDYATGTEAGVIKVVGSAPFHIYNGELRATYAGEYEIKTRQNPYILNSLRTEFIVKAGLTGLKLVNGVDTYGQHDKQLSTAERDAAQKWLGMPVFGDRTIDITYTTDKGFYPLNIGNAYKQTDEIYSSNELLDATVTYYDGSSSLKTTTLSSEHLSHEDEFGATYKVVDNVYIIIVYQNGYFPPAANDAMGYGKGTFFVYYDNDGLYYVNTLKKVDGKTIPLDNKYLDIKDNEVIKALDTKIGDIEVVLDSIITLQNTYIGGES